MYRVSVPSVARTTQATTYTLVERVSDQIQIKQKAEQLALRSVAPLSKVNPMASEPISNAVLHQSVLKICSIFNK